MSIAMIINEMIIMQMSAERAAEIERLKVDLRNSQDELKRGHAEIERLKADLRRGQATSPLAASPSGIAEWHV